MRSEYTKFIGVDPSFRRNGFAICIIDTSDNTVRFKVFKDGFLGFIKWFNHDSPSEALICVENSNLQEQTWDMSGTRGEVARKSRNVGKNQAISQCTVDMFKTKYKVIDCSPKYKGGKWTDQTYNSVMAYKKHTTNKVTSNQDERDSYKLALMALERPWLAK